MADLDNKLVTFASLKETVTRLKEYANQFEPRKEVVSKAKLTYSTNYIRAYCDYVATIPTTVRVTDDDGSVLLVTGSANGSWRAVRLIKGETDRFHKVYYKDGYVYIQVDNDSMYTIFGGSSVKVFGSATGTEITIENAADTDIEIPTSYPANAIGYVNDAIGSTNVDDALNTVIAELHTHDNKDVLDLLSESDTGKLQYNGVAIGGSGVLEAKLTFTKDVGYVSAGTVYGAGTKIEDILREMVYKQPTDGLLTYYGYFDCDATGTVVTNPTVDDVKALNSEVIGTKEFTFNIDDMKYGQIAYAYPASFGKLSKITVNGMINYLNSCTKVDMIIDGINYVLYFLTDPCGGLVDIPIECA